MPRKKAIRMTEATDAKTVRTLDEKIAATEALLAKYRQQKLTEALLNNIEVGDDVDFNYGRAETRRVITGSVTVGITEDESWGKIVGIEAGEGFDKKVYKVRVADIVANRTADARPVEGADADPLNAA